MMRRILSAWLPHWPLTRLPANASAPDPLATVTTEGGLRRIAAIAPALAGRIAPSMPLTHARAIVADLPVIDADPQADAAALDRLAAWAARYTPLTAADPPEEGLWLDITGCAHLFGGEQALLDDLCDRLARRGLPVRAAIAGTTGCAWALSRSPFGPARVVLPPGSEQAALAKLPAASLRLDARTIAGLRRVGLRTVGEIQRQSRSELAARYGATVGLRLDHALRPGAEAIAWRHAPAPYEERLAFAEPIGTPEDLARALTQLTAELCERLAHAHEGARKWRATFCRTDGTTQQATAATGLATHDAAHLTRLLVAALDTVDPGFGVDAVILAAADIDAAAPTQSALYGQTSAGKLETTLDLLAHRLGEDRLRRPAPHASHLPERAWKPQPRSLLSRGTGGAGNQMQTAWPTLPRPLRLLRTPEPVEVTHLLPDAPPLTFRWRKTIHRIRAATGPERIAPEWWRPGPQATRDYYEVEDSNGARYWLFRAGVQSWFLHGFFG